MPFDFDPSGVGPPLSRPGYLVVVQRYDPDSPGNPLSLLPNVQCLEVDEREGMPAVARFRYILDDSDSAPGPDGFEDLIPIIATGPNVVQNGDRITVTVAYPNGPFTVIFDGHAEMPDAGMESGSQHATFSAQSVAVRLWDWPMAGALYRPADAPSTPGNEVATELPIRFNPDDRGHEPIPNATPFGCDLSGTENPSDAGALYPVFLDPRPAEETTEDEEEDDEETPEGDDDDDSTTPPGDTRRPWTLDMAVKYLLWQGNFDQQYATHYPTNKLGQMLQAIAPSLAGKPINLANPGTYTNAPIFVRDYDASNKPCMDAIRELIWPHGFRFRFAITPYSDGSPKTSIKFYRRDGLYGMKPKTLLLQPTGSPLDPGASNISAFSLNRGPVRHNEVEIETDPVLYEVAVILAPGFEIVASAPANLKYFTRANIAITPSAADLYRLFIFDECGDGHWNFATGAMDKTPGDSIAAGLGSDRTLDDIFDAAKSSNTPVSVRRYRPGGSELVMKQAGRPMQARLDVATSYGGAAPGIHDGTTGGPWQPVASGDWRLLRSRLGILFTCDSPNDISLGTPPDGTANVMGRGGKLKLVELLAAAAAAGSAVPLFFRLTCTIRADTGLGITSKRRLSSPTPFTITTRVDCRDHYRKSVIDGSSPNYADADEIGTVVNNQVVIRDDTAKAQAYADAIRASAEFGEWTGTATIPRFSLAYDVGDRIAGIAGRTASMQQNAGSGAGESPTYPIVVGRRFIFEAGQFTILEFSTDDQKAVEI